MRPEQRGHGKIEPRQRIVVDNVFRHTGEHPHSSQAQEESDSQMQSEVLAADEARSDESGEPRMTFAKASPVP